MCRGRRAARVSSAPIGAPTFWCRRRGDVSKCFEINGAASMFHRFGRRRLLIAGAAATAALTYGIGVAAAAGVIPLNPFGTSHVGTQADGTVLLPDNQQVTPFGQRAATFSAQTIGTATSPDGTKVATQTGGNNLGKPQLSIL